MTKTRQWTVFTAIAVLIVVAAGWLLLIKPQRSKASDLRTQASSEQGQVASLQQQVSQLEGQQRNLPREQQSLQHFATQVPDGPDEPQLLRDLSTAANGSGVDLISVTPGTPAAVTATSSTGATTLAPGATATAAPGLTELPLSLGIAGNYPNLEMFFQSLEKLPRSLMVTGWSICPENSAGSGGGGAPTGNASGGSTCSAPSLPLASGQTAQAGTLGGTLSTLVYFSGVGSPTTTPSSTTTSTGTGATGTTPTTSSSTSPSTAPSTAASAPSN